jgi:UDP-N-acetylmuramoylalanine-D-glutamate ligase
LILLPQGEGRGCIAAVDQFLASAAFDPSPARGEGMQGEDAVILPSPACAAFDQFPDFEVGDERINKCT